MTAGECVREKERERLDSWRVCERERERKEEREREREIREAIRGEPRRGRVGLGCRAALAGGPDLSEL